MNIREALAALLNELPVGLQIHDATGRFISHTKLNDAVKIARETLRREELPSIYGSIGLRFVKRHVDCDNGEGQKRGRMLSILQHKVIIGFKPYEQEEWRDVPVEVEE